VKDIVPPFSLTRTRFWISELEALMKRISFEPDIVPGLSGRTMTDVQHLTQLSDSAITIGPFLRLLLTLPDRQKASAANVSDLSRMEDRNDAVAGRSMTVCMTKQAAEGGLDELVFRLVSLER
jgi:hypothetical protein